MPSRILKSVIWLIKIKLWLLWIKFLVLKFPAFLLHFFNNNQSIFYSKFLYYFISNSIWFIIISVIYKAIVIFDYSKNNLRKLIIKVTQCNTVAKMKVDTYTKYGRKVSKGDYNHCEYVWGLNELLGK